jgi:hypothetical protein
MRFWQMILLLWSCLMYISSTFCFDTNTPTDNWQETFEFYKPTTDQNIRCIINFFEFSEEILRIWPFGFLNRQKSRFQIGMGVCASCAEFAVVGIIAVNGVTLVTAKRKQKNANFPQLQDQADESDHEESNHHETTSAHSHSNHRSAKTHATIEWPVFLEFRNSISQLAIFESWTNSFWLIQTGSPPSSATRSLHQNLSCILPLKNNLCWFCFSFSFCPCLASCLRSPAAPHHHLNIHRSIPPSQL